MSAYYVQLYVSPCLRDPPMLGGVRLARCFNGGRRPGAVVAVVGSDLGLGLPHGSPLAKVRPIVLEGSMKYHRKRASPE